MKVKCFAIFAILLVGLSLATAQQQNITDKPTPSQISELVKLSFRLGVAYLLAQQSQDVAGFNSLVDQYNALVWQNFSGNADALLIAKINATNLTTTTNLTEQQVTTKNLSPSVMKTPFKESSDLSKFGKQPKYVKQQVKGDVPRQMRNIENTDDRLVSDDDDWVNWENR
jgi:hypothetical protein